MEVWAHSFKHLQLIYATAIGTICEFEQLYRGHRLPRDISPDARRLSARLSGQFL